MQDKISDIESSLLKLLEMSKDNEHELDEMNKESLLFRSYLESLFSENYSFCESDLKRLSDIQIKYTELCSLIASEKEAMKQSILTVMKNKKNVGAYKQYK
jgi:hypothetical protein